MHVQGWHMGSNGDTKEVGNAVMQIGGRVFDFTIMLVAAIFYVLAVVVTHVPWEWHDLIVGKMVDMGQQESKTTSSNGRMEVLGW